MELLLIRHGLPVRVEDLDGPADPELSESGRAQAEALAALAGAVRPRRAARARCDGRSRPLARWPRRTASTPLVDAGVAEMDPDARYYVPMEELKGTERSPLGRGDGVLDLARGGPHAPGLPPARSSRPSTRRSWRNPARGGWRCSATAAWSTPTCPTCSGSTDASSSSPPTRASAGCSPHSDGRRQIASVNETPHLPRHRGRRSPTRLGPRHLRSRAAPCRRGRRRAGRGPARRGCCA